MRRAALVALLALCAGGELGAQADTARADTPRMAPLPVPCNGQVISDIIVGTRPPFHGREDRYWGIPSWIVTHLHVTTRDRTVRKYLYLTAGSPCDERMRADSERILRQQRFIASARIRAYPDEQGSVTIIVETVDEFTPILSIYTNSGSAALRGVALGDGNVYGSGRLLRTEYRTGQYRDIFALRVADPNFLGRRYVLESELARGDLGEHRYAVDITQPFYTDLQRTAWRIRTDDHSYLFDFYRGGLDPVPARLERDFVDVGGVVRIGQPGRLSLFGVSMSRERHATGLPPAPDSLVDYDVLLSPYSRRNNARINAHWGVRNVDFRRVERFQSLSGTQDVMHGFQLGTIFGRGLTVLGTTDDDILLGGDLYLGAGTERSLLTLQGRGEGRHNYDAHEWDNVITSATATGYYRVAERHTLTLQADWGAGWRQRIPMQLTLGDEIGGVRGFRRSREAGARREVIRAEHRWLIPGIHSQADGGLAGFAEAGRLHRGDAPFGVNTPVRASAGLSFLAAVPRGSQRTFRLDVAVPVTGGGGVEFRFSSRSAHRRFYREPNDLARGREQAVPSSVFGWP